MGALLNLRRVKARMAAQVGWHATAYKVYVCGVGVGVGLAAWLPGHAAEGVGQPGMLHGCRRCTLYVSYRARICQLQLQPPCCSHGLLLWLSLHALSTGTHPACLPAGAVPPSALHYALAD
jgi:hypothetical protein